METMVKIGANVRRLRKARVLRQTDLAEKAGISPAALVRIENNQVDPHVTTIRKLAAALGVEPAELVEN